MKVAISNIAWDIAQDEEVRDLLTRMGVSAIEIAPTKIWPDIESVKTGDVRQYREFWNSRTIDIVAMQSLLFGKPELTLFDSEQQRAGLGSYLRKVIDLAAALGVTRLVFGSPKNRLVPGDMIKEKADEIAAVFFSEMAEYCKPYGIYFGLEANPEQYGANYITNNDQALTLVQKVNHPNFRLHLDTGIMIMNKESVESTVQKVLPFTEHVHISEPQLDPIGTHNLNHAQVAEALQKAGYDKHVSIEMRQPSEDVPQVIRGVLEQVITTYSPMQT